MNIVKCKIALNKLNNPHFPYQWDLNIYRGCTNGCKYCYAIYSHQHLEGDFFKDIYIKENIIEVLEKELKSPKWKQEIVNIGGITDSYQGIESKVKLMPEILKLMIKYRTPVIISTKSNLILRDYDLIDKLSKLTYVNIATSITSFDENIAEKLERGASSPNKRVEILKEFKKTNASIGLHAMPIIPLITDGENLELLYKTAKEIGVDYVLPGTLYLKGTTKPYFMNAIHKEFPLTSPHIKYLYRSGKLEDNCKKRIYKQVANLEKKYSISRNYNLQIEMKLKSPEDRYYNNLLFEL